MPSLCPNKAQRETAGTVQNTQPAQLPEQHAENASAPENISASANGFTTQDVYSLIAGVNATPCPLDFLIYSFKTPIFNIDEDTPNDTLKNYLSNMDDVKKNFDTAVQQMYGVHVQGYNSYLNDLLGEARAQKYLISDERLKTSFHAFYGSMEKYRYDVLDTCERLKQCIINLDNTVKDKASRTEANSNHKMLMGGAAVVAGFLTGGIALPLMAGAGLLAKNSGDKAALEQYDRQIENINRTIYELKQKLKQSTDAVLEIVKKEQLNLINGPLLSALCNVLNTEIKSGSMSFDALRKALSAAIQKEERDCRTVTAQMYHVGISVPQDLQQAYNLYLASAEQNSGDALAALGFMHKNGDYVSENPEKAFAYFKKAAELGSADGIEALGNCYINGYGTQENAGKGFELFLKAAEMGSKSAQVAVAVCHFNGTAVEQSFDKAYKLLKPLAEEGEATAQLYMGLMYDNGLAVRENKKEALKWYQRAANAGNLDAIVQLGTMYQNGFGVKQDTTMAVNYYERAAEQGHPKAQALLGSLYVHDPEYLIENEDRGWALLQQSAETGDADAQLMYGAALADMNADYNNAVKWYVSSANQGNTMAMNALAECYENGRGVRENKREAKRLYKMAMDNGYDEARDGFDRVKYL